MDLLTYKLPTPICASDPWPSDYESCLVKFNAYNIRMEHLLSKRNKAEEHPKKVSWSLGPEEPLYSSASILWDVLNVYHLMGVMYWNRAATYIRENEDPKVIRPLVMSASSFFGAISNLILPSWSVACRYVYTSQSKPVLVVPSFLMENPWKMLQSASVTLIYLALCTRVRSSPNGTYQACKAMKGGLESIKEIERPVSPFFQAIHCNMTSLYRDICLFCWCENNNVEKEHQGEVSKIMLDLSTRTTSILGITNLKERALQIKRDNESIYFELVPSTSIDDAILDSIQSYRIAEQPAIDVSFCCIGNKPVPI